jgi:hypothetical protein
MDLWLTVLAILIAMLKSAQAYDAKRRQHLA